MKVLTLLIAFYACAACAASGGKGWMQAHKSIQERKDALGACAAKQPSTEVAAALSGGASLLDPLDQGKVMTFRTALKYKAGLVLETGLLLAVLAGSKEVYNRAATPQLQTVVDLSTWALIIFGSDGIVGLLRQLQVRLGLAEPRQTLADSQKTWYKAIDKPRWTPKDWVFPAVWIPLKICQVFAARIVWATTGRTFNLPVVLFVVHQALGDLWNTAFFREHYIKGGLSIILQFFAVLVATTYQFNKVDPLAGLFMVPTCLWLIVATSLNFSIYRKNY